MPITFVDRVHGKSKMSSREMIDGVLSVLTLGSALDREPATAALASRTELERPSR